TADISPGHPMRAAFAGNLLPRRVFGLRRAIHHRRMVRRPAITGGDQSLRHFDNDCDSLSDLVVQGGRRAKCPSACQGGGCRPRGRRGMKLIFAVLTVVLMTGPAAAVAEGCDVPSSLAF